MAFARIEVITRYQAKGWSIGKFVNMVCNHPSICDTANPPTVRNHLSGKTKNPVLPYLEAYAAVLGCTVDDLTRKDDEV
jgi:hypothetical protein